MLKLAELIELNAEELATLESVNVGKPLMFSKMVDIKAAV